MKRPFYIERVAEGLDIHPVVALLGPRQCGKTTLAHDFVEQNSHHYPQAHFFDLEKPEDLARLSNPYLVLSSLSGLIVIDEIQRFPDLFPILRVVVDESKGKSHFLILGSASRDLIKQSSESLAGRIQYIELTPFNLLETGDKVGLWLRGGFPRSYLAKNDNDSFIWRENYVQTFLERDIPNLGINIPAVRLRRFWTLLAHYHGTIVNYTELARAMDISVKTVKHYIDLLISVFMVRSLQPWHVNIKKRQVKSPKIYLRDSGLANLLLNIPNMQALGSNPKQGALWEGFLLEEVIRYHQIRPEECYFWGSHGDAELDLLLVRGDKQIGVEFKYTERPTVTRSMHVVLDDLKLDHLYVIYPGSTTFPLTEKITAISIMEYLKTQPRLGV